MSEPSSTASSVSHAHHALQRGKACLRCRKRKMRCDGSKPSCQQCVRAKKGDQCQYDDGQGKTRTQLMREHISRLERRLNELEDPDHQQLPSVYLFDPVAASQNGSSSSSDGGSPTASILPVSSTYIELPNLENMFQFQTSLSPTSAGPMSGFFEEPQPPIELAELLLDIFAPHQHQLGLHIDLAVLRESLTQPAPSRRFGCLLNVVWVWACFLSRPGPLASSEVQYVKLALESLQLSLAEPKRLVDVVLASSLLAKYFYMCGRVLEGSYHHGAAAALAVRWDLHRAPGAAAPSGGCFSLPPCKDQREEGERIVAFWMVHDLDRCWNTVMTRVPSVPDSLYIDAPWPQPAEDYQNLQREESREFDTIQAFIAGTAPPGSGLSLPAVRAKAAALFAAAGAAAGALDANADLSALAPAHLPGMAPVERAATELLAALLPIAQLLGAAPEVRQALVGVYSVAFGALIKLAEPLANAGSAPAHATALAAARQMVELIRHVADADWAFLDCLIGPTWLLAATVLFREVSLVESAAWPLIGGDDARSDLALLHYAMTNMAGRFPVLANYASQIQNGLAAISL